MKINIGGSLVFGLTLMLPVLDLSTSVDTRANPSIATSAIVESRGSTSGVIDKNWDEDPRNYYVTNRLVPNPSISVPILEYHEANYVPGDIATLKPGQLLSEMEWLHAHDFHTINFGQLYAALYHGYPLPSRPILLTFDDGYESVYFKVFPLLKQLHFEATLFIIAGYTHKSPNRDKLFPNLTISEIQEMQNSGLVDIEDHTMSHRNLTKVNSSQAMTEIRGSATVLEKIVNHPMIVFCYPDGGYNSRIISLLQNSGYLLATTQTGGYASLANGRFTLDRISVLDYTTLQDFAKRLQPSFRSGSYPMKPSNLQKTVESDYEAGVQAFREKNYVKAVEFENKALQLDRSFYPAYNIKGIALCYASTQNYASAMSCINMSLKLDSNYGYARFNKALCEERYANYDSAIATYKWALSLKSHDWWVPWCDYGIASIYGRRGDVGDTVKYLKEAITMNSSLKQEARTESDFNPVRQSRAFQQLIQ